MSAPQEQQGARIDGARPIAKVVAGTVAGAATVVLVYVARLLGLEVPAEVASAVTVLLSTGTAYLKS